MHLSLDPPLHLYLRVLSWWSPLPQYDLDKSPNPLHITIFFCFVKVHVLIHLFAINLNLFLFPSYNSTSLDKSSTLQFFFSWQALVEKNVGCPIDCKTKLGSCQTLHFEGISHFECLSRSSSPPLINSQSETKKDFYACLLLTFFIYKEPSTCINIQWTLLFSCFVNQLGLITIRNLLSLAWNVLAKWVLLESACALTKSCMW